MKLVSSLREILRTRHYSRRTEKAYVGWVVRFLCGLPREMAPQQLDMGHVTRFLSRLAMEDRVAASTQNQAFSALLFLFREVLKRDFEGLDQVARAKQPVRVPQVLSRTEVSTILGRLLGTPWLMASLMYGCGLRLLECCRLRVKDIDFARNEITVRDGKGAKDRVTMLPARVADPLRRHLDRTRRVHLEDLNKGLGGVALPHAFARKDPNAASGPGSGSFRPSGSTSTGASVNATAITCMSRSCSVRSRMRCRHRGSRRGRAATLSVIMPGPGLCRVGSQIGREWADPSPRDAA